MRELLPPRHNESEVSQCIGDSVKESLPRRDESEASQCIVSFADLIQNPCLRLRRDVAVTLWALSKSDESTAIRSMREFLSAVID